MKKILDPKHVTTLIAISIIVLESGLFELNSVQSKIAYIVVGILGVFGYKIQDLKDAVSKLKK